MIFSAGSATTLKRCLMMSPEELPCVISQEYVSGRRDKDEHTLLRRPRLTYSCILFKYYTESEQFSCPGWTVWQALCNIVITYLLHYTHRFRQPVKFTEDVIPLAIARHKAKCSADGRRCQ